MPRSQRVVPDGALVEITFRTMGSRLLLSPTAAINAMILGVLGRALALYDVALHAFVFLTNHGHLLATVPSRRVMSLFLSHLEGNVARGIQRETPWDLRVWGRRASVVNVVDDGAAVDRLTYILAHGAKEGLVRSPRQWPGATSTRALLGEEELTGIWIDRTKAYEARRRKRPVDPSTYTTEYPIRLAPLPCWARIAPEEHQRRCREIVEQIEAKYVHLGAAEVPPAHEFGAAPRETKRSPTPKVHASTPESAARFLELRRALLEARRAGPTPRAPREPGPMAADRRAVAPHREPSIVPASRPPAAVGVAAGAAGVGPATPKHWSRGRPAPPRPP